MTARRQKVAVMALARDAGWEGQTYHSAKKFRRKLALSQRAYASWIDEERAGSVPHYEIPERTPHRSWRRWFLKARRRA